MVAVRGVAVALVNVVGVVPVTHRLVTTALAMAVLVLVVRDVVLEHAFVPVAVMVPMDMAVVEIVGVVAVLNGDVAAVGPMAVAVLRVGLVGGSGHESCSSWVGLGRASGR
jgi:hypothetical protein